MLDWILGAVALATAALAATDIITAFRRPRPKTKDKQSKPTIDPNRCQ
jgi:hypothetical protein